MHDESSISFADSFEMLSSVFGSGLTYCGRPLPSRHQHILESMKAAATLLLEAVRFESIYAIEGRLPLAAMPLRSSSPLS
jgi:3-phosphoglycerate kinase